MIKVFHEHTMIDTFVNIILFPFMQFIKIAAGDFVQLIVKKPKLFDLR